MLVMARASEIRIREADIHDRETFQKLMLEAYGEIVIEKLGTYPPTGSNFPALWEKSLPIW
jgi:hypothetical protein